MEFQVELNEKYNFKKLYCQEGHIIANIKNGINIEDYVGGEQIFMPITATTDEYVCISKEAHEEICKQRDEYFEKLNEQLAHEE